MFQPLSPFLKVFQTAEIFKPINYQAGNLQETMAIDHAMWERVKQSIGKIFRDD